MRIFGKIASRLRNYYRLIFLGDRFAIDIRRWFADNGDRTLRLEYGLSKDCTVFDVGGYEGSWAEEVFAKFSCRIHVFEPVAEFAAAIQTRFADRLAVKVHPYGLSNVDGEFAIDLSGDGSSFYVKGSSTPAKAKVRRFDLALLKELGVSRIDLMKINIEGGEYDLLDLMIQNGTIGLVSNLQIQFNNFVPNAIERRNDIRGKLGITHSETWCYEFVWESWRLKDAGPWVT